MLDELIDGQRRLAELAQLKNQIQPLKAAIETADEGLKRCNAILADAKPFDLVDDTVVIRPVRFQLE
ncbi:MAG TPA: hypothetical protein VNH11_13865 [Pirellulales bacterium]|nr:hypothetical protein [Pirellulales bacterium]